MEERKKRVNSGKVLALLRERVGFLFISTWSEIALVAFREKKSRRLTLSGC